MSQQETTDGLRLRRGARYRLSKGIVRVHDVRKIEGKRQVWIAFYQHKKHPRDVQFRRGTLRAFAGALRAEMAHGR